jgi:hypothetical protein
MTNKPNAYPTAEHFARARADIARRRAQLIESEEAARAVLAGYNAAMAMIDSEIAEIDACELAGAAIVERYSDPPGSKRTPMSKLRPPAAGKLYKSADDAQIIVAERGELEQLARDMGRPYAGLLKRHEILIKQRKPEKTDTLAPDPALEMMEKGEEPINLIEQFAPPENEATAAPDTDPAAVFDSLHSVRPRELAEADAQRKSSPPVKPGRAVDGIVDNGPGRSRVYDPVAFASSRSE